MQAPTLAVLGEVQVTLSRLWNGIDAGRTGASVTLRFSAAELLVTVDAPYFGDPAPSLPVGSTPGLFEHEVVELFLLGAGDRYLEVELSPRGHYWVLGLEGRRQVAWEGRALLYTAHVEGARWRGQARIPLAWLPDGLSHLNVTAIDGVGAARRYWSLAATRGPVPDFHDLEAFVPLTDVLRAE